MDSRLKRKCFLIILCLYVAFLFVASWPSVFFPTQTRTIQQFAYRTLTRIAVLPGLKLFHRPYPEAYKVHGQCITFKGWTEDERIIPLITTGSACEPRANFQFFGNPYEIIFSRFVEEAALERIQRRADLSEEVFASHAPISARENALYESLGDYFCHSRLAKLTDTPLKNVFMGWRQDKIGYAKNDLISNYVLLTKWNCWDHKIESVQWQPFINQLDLQNYLGDRAW